MTKIRVGQGIDIHPFERGRPLFLGGVKIPHFSGLQGHSDADALLHAVCDALLGALGLGDIGQYFSDQDAKNKNRPSEEFLKEIVSLIKNRGWTVGNVDSTIITEEPMLKPYMESMKSKLAQLLEVSVEQVSVKATRPEKLGSLGRKEGLTALCVALLEKK